MLRAGSRRFAFVSSSTKDFQHRSRRSIEPRFFTNLPSTNHRNSTLRPLVVLSSIIAKTLANAGWPKLDEKRYLYEHARRPAWEFERQLREWNISVAAEREQHVAPYPGTLDLTVWLTRATCTRGTRADR
jgi:hypothetical protein